MSSSSKSRGRHVDGHTRGLSTGSRTSISESYLLSRPSVSSPLSSGTNSFRPGDDGQFTSVHFGRGDRDPRGSGEDDGDAYFRELEVSMRRNSAKAQGKTILKALSAVALVLVFFLLLVMSPAVSWTNSSGSAIWDDFSTDGYGGGVEGESQTSAEVRIRPGVLPPPVPSESIPVPSIALDAPVSVSVVPSSLPAPNGVADLENQETAPASGSDSDSADESPSLPSSDIMSSIESVDVAFCGTSPCRIVLPAIIGEGESKAQMHLGGVLASAHLLNATFITPNTNRGLFSSCRQHPFDFYFDVDEIGARWGVRTRSYKEYEEWILKRNKLGSKPSVHQVTLREESKGQVDLMDVQITKKRPPQKLCYQGELDWTRFYNLTFSPRPGWYRDWRNAQTFADFLIRGLSDAEEVRKYRIPHPDSDGTEAVDDDDDSSAELALPEIIAYDWHLKYAAFPAPEKSHVDRTTPIRLPYAPRWQEQGRNISSRLSPFISIHWRMETVNPDKLMSCSHELHAKIKEIGERYPDIKNVYFLTDFPMEGDSHPHSSTFKPVSSQARAAMADFLDNFSDRTGGTIGLTTLVKELPFVKGFQGKKDIPVESLDMGLVGIIDKVMAEDAEIFLTGVPRTCARYSSFTKQVVAERREKVDKGEQRNVVDYWPSTDEPWY